MKHVRDLMTTEVQTAHTRQKLSEVSQLLRQQKFHHIPVLSGREPVGVITTGDLYKLVYDAGNTDERMIDAMLDAQYNVEQVMSRDIKTISQDAKLKEAAELLSTGSLHSLLVVDAEGHFAGILTSTDLIRHLYDQLR